MPSFERQAPSISVQPIPGAVAGPDTSNAQLVQSVAGLINTVASQNQAETQAEVKQADTAFLNSFEDALLYEGEAGSEVFGRIKEQEQKDPDLTVDDQKILTEAQGAASSIDRLDRAGKGADIIARRRIAEYQKFKTVAPHLAPELRDLFKKQIGKGVLQSMVELEQSNAAAKAKEAQAQKDFYINFLTQHSMYVPGMSIADMATRAEPLLKDLRDLESSKRQLDLLKTNTEINATHRRVSQQVAFRQGFPGMVVAVNQTVQNLIAQADFNPETATVERRQQLRDQILNRKHLNEVAVRDLGDSLDATYLDKRLSVVNDIFDKALEVVDGKRTLESLTTINNIRTQMSVHKLLEYPGLSDKLVALDKLKGIDAGLLRAQDQLDVSTEVALPLMKGLMAAVGNPTSNPYEELSYSATPGGQVNFYKKMTEVLNKNLDNEEAKGEVRDIMEAWSNQAGLNPTSIPTGVLSALFDTASNPQWIEIQKGGTHLADNITSALQEYGSRIQNKMGEDLKKSLTGYAPVAGASTRDENQIKTSFLGVDVSPAVALKYPRVADVVDIKLNKDGSLSFEPIAQLRSDPRIRSLSRDLSQKYSKEFGKMVRTYAHTVNEDTNYGNAAKDLMQSPGLSQANVTQAPVNVE